MNRPYHLDPKPENVRAIWVYKNWAPSGSSSRVGLGLTSEGTAKAIRQAGIHTEVIGMRTAAELAAYLTLHSTDQRPITHIVIGACWISADDLASLSQAWTEIVFVVVSHSTVSFLHADPQGVKNLRGTIGLSQQVHNVSVAGNNRKFSGWAEKTYGAQIEELPNLYSLHGSRPKPHLRWDGHILKTGCFGAFRPWKNINTAAAAALEMQARLNCELEFHVNGSDSHGSTVLESIVQMFDGVPGAKLIRHGWLSWLAFLVLLRSLDLCFQPSYTETFNNVTADALHEGVPTVVSSAIEWVPKSWVAHYDEATDIASVGSRLLHDPHAISEAVATLGEHNKRALAQWHEFLTRRR